MKDQLKFRIISIAQIIMITLCFITIINLGNQIDNTMYETVSKESDQYNHFIVQLARIHQNDDGGLRHVIALVNHINTVPDHYSALMDEDLNMLNRNFQVDGGPNQEPSIKSLNILDFPEIVDIVKNNSAGQIYLSKYIDSKVILNYEWFPYGEKKYLLLNAVCTSTIVSIYTNKALYILLAFFILSAVLQFIEYRKLFDFTMEKIIGERSGDE